MDSLDLLVPARPAGFDCRRESCDCAIYQRVSETAWADGDHAIGLAHAEKATRADCASRGGPCAFFSSMRLAILLSRVRRVQEAWRAYDAGQSALHSMKHFPPFDPAELSSIAKLVAAGIKMNEADYPKSTELAEEGLLEAAGAGLTSWIPLGHLASALSGLRMGDLPLASRYARLLKEDEVFSRGMRSTGETAWILVQLAEGENDPAKAWSLAVELATSAAALQELMVAQPGAVPWIVRFAVKCGCPDIAKEVEELARRVASRNPSLPSLTAAAVHATGVLHADGESLLTAAHRHLDPWARASAIEDRGVQLMRQATSLPEAIDVLKLASDGYLATGALRDVSRVRSRLWDLGERSNPRQSGRPLTAVPALTDTECAVARLVAMGFTNGQAGAQLYLSRHTVAFHLRKIFRKLDIESRVQLARMWTQISEYQQ